MERCKDQNRQKLEDVFSGQEPVAKISVDVNSSAFFKSAHDTRRCQENIKQKKEKVRKRWRTVVQGEVIHEQCHSYVYFLPFLLF